MHHTRLLFDTINLHIQKLRNHSDTSHVIHCQVLFTVSPMISWTNSLLSIFMVPTLMLQGCILHPPLFPSLSTASSHSPYFQWFLLLLEWNLNSNYRPSRWARPMSAAPIQNPLPGIDSPSVLQEHWPSYRRLNRIYMDVVHAIFFALPRPASSTLSSKFYLQCLLRKSYLLTLHEGKPPSCIP